MNLLSISPHRVKPFHKDIASGVSFAGCSLAALGGLTNDALRSVFLVYAFIVFFAYYVTALRYFSGVHSLSCTT